jgi:hypothetical protein
MWVLLSGLIGALAVFFMGIAREWWRNEQERRGLLRLLLSEIKHNAELVSLIRESGAGFTEQPDILALKTETWQETRARAARLLPAEMLQALDDYYSRLETLLSLRHLSLIGEKMMGRWILAIARGETDDDLEWSTNPFGWYLARTLEAESQVRSSITEYLESARRPRLWR